MQMQVAVLLLNELGSRRSLALLQVTAIAIRGAQGMYQALDGRVQEESEMLFLPQAVCALAGEIRHVV